MSYILDALKKSDQERKRGDVPGLQTVHIPMTTEQATPWVLYGFVTFLLLALAFVIGMMVSEKTTQVNSALHDEAEGESRVIPSKVSEPVLNKPVQPVKTETKQDKTKAVHEVAQMVENRQVSPVIELPKASEAPISVQQLSEVPYLYELEDYQQQSIPQMSFAGHVYSSTPASRSIIINNNALSEGDNIMPGLKVEMITSNGVVFRFQDMLFKMDILQDWSFE